MRTVHRGYMSSLCLSIDGHDSEPDVSQATPARLREWRWAAAWPEANVLEASVSFKPAGAARRGPPLRCAAASESARMPPVQQLHHEDLAGAWVLLGKLVADHASTPLVRPPHHPNRQSLQVHQRGPGCVEGPVLFVNHWLPAEPLSAHRTVQCVAIRRRPQPIASCSSARQTAPPPGPPARARRRQDAVARRAADAHGGRGAGCATRLRAPRPGSRTGC